MNNIKTVKNLVDRLLQVENKLATILIWKDDVAYVGEVEHGIDIDPKTYKTTDVEVHINAHVEDEGNCIKYNTVQDLIDKLLTLPQSIPVKVFMFEGEVEDISMIDEDIRDNNGISTEVHINSNF